jgi:urease accessory protein
VRPTDLAGGGVRAAGEAGRRHATAARLALLWAGLWLALPAAAHVEIGQAAGFFSGLMHPVSGLDHVLAMVAVGLWGAHLGAPAIWLLPVTFPLVMACGGFLALVGVPLPGVEIGIASSAILLGTLVATQLRAPIWLAAVVVGFFAVFHGHAHGTELPPGQSGLLYSVGFVVATGCLHAAGVAFGLLHRWRWGQTVLRTAGAVIGAAGVFFLWRAA